MNDRQQWEYSGSSHEGKHELKGDWWLYDGDITVSAHKDGVLIEIVEEQAIDSYNADVKCSVLLPLDKAAELGRFLALFTSRS